MSTVSAIHCPGFRDTWYFSVYGWPAIPVPGGCTASGLPIGLHGVFFRT